MANRSVASECIYPLSQWPTMSPRDHRGPAVGTNNWAQSYGLNPSAEAILDWPTRAGGIGTCGEARDSSCRHFSSGGVLGQELPPEKDQLKVGVVTQSG